VQRCASALSQVHVCQPLCRYCSACVCVYVRAGTAIVTRAASIRVLMVGDMRGGALPVTTTAYSVRRLHRAAAAVVCMVWCVRAANLYSMI
jgi:hypothetical protein